MYVLRKLHLGLFPEREHCHDFHIRKFVVPKINGERAIISARGIYRHLKRIDRIQGAVHVYDFHILWNHGGHVFYGPLHFCRRKNKALFVHPVKDFFFGVVGACGKAKHRHEHKDNLF